MKKEIKPVNLNSKVIAKLRESDLTIGEFIKRYDMKRRLK